MNDPVKQFAQLLAKTDAAGMETMMARAKMMAMQEASDEVFEAPIRTLGDYLAMEIPVPPTLVEPMLVVRGGITCTIGRAGKGKTVMNLNRMMKWASGKPFFDTFVDIEDRPLLMPSHPLRILIIENEGAAGLFHRQIGKMAAAEYLTSEDKDLIMENVLIWGDGGYSNLKLDDPSCLDTVKAGVEKWEPDLVFIEPFRGLWRGEENSATDMAVVVDALVDIAATYNCGVMLAHHERKSGVGEDREKMSAGRGSTVLEGAVSVMENFESVKDGAFRELSWSKSRHGVAPPTVRMEWDPENWWYRHVPLDQIDQMILDVLAANDEPMSVAEFVEESKEKADAVRKTLKRLEELNHIKKIKQSYGGDGGSRAARYRLVGDDDAGEDSPNGEGLGF